MSLIGENVIPGDHGKMFYVDINDERDFQEVKQKILKIEGVKDVLYNTEAYPSKMTIHSLNLVKVKDIQDAVREKGFHAVPAGLFQL